MIYRRIVRHPETHAISRRGRLPCRPGLIAELDPGNPGSNPRCHFTTQIFALAR